MVEKLLLPLLRFEQQYEGEFLHQNPTFARIDLSNGKEGSSLSLLLKNCRSNEKIRLDGLGIREGEKGRRRKK